MRRRVSPQARAEKLEFTGEIVEEEEEGDSPEEDRIWKGGGWSSSSSPQHPIFLPRKRSCRGESLWSEGRRK